MARGWDVGPLIYLSACVKWRTGLRDARPQALRRRGVLLLRLTQPAELVFLGTRRDLELVDQPLDLAVFLHHRRRELVHQALVARHPRRTFRGRLVERNLGCGVLKVAERGEIGVAQLGCLHLQRGDGLVLMRAIVARDRLWFRHERAPIDLRTWGCLLRSRWLWPRRSRSRCGGVAGGALRGVNR